MTPAERRFVEKAQRRVAGMEPGVRAAVLRAFEILRESMTEAQLTRIVELGQLDRLFSEALSEAVLERAFKPLRARIINTVERGFKFTTPELPKAGKVDGVIAVSFEHLNPRVIDAVRTLDTEVIGTLKSDVREVVRAHVENGLRDGRPPRSVARELRGVIGLAPNQEKANQNFRRMLETGDREALSRALRDKRFDATLERALGPNGTGLSKTQIDVMVDANRRKAIKQNADSVTKTVTLDSYKRGQRLSWESARDNGVVPPGAALKRRWTTVGDDRVRPEHMRMNGETVGFDEPFSNSEMEPGDSTWGCRCLARVIVVKA